MIWTVLLNGLPGFIIVLTIHFRMGNIEGVLSLRIEKLFTQVFSSATGSHTDATTVSVIITAMALYSTIDVVAKASRLMFAFARD